MTTRDRPPRILIVTPEVTAVPQGMGKGSRGISARAGGLGDICSAQIHALYDRGVDVHLAIPNYRNLFRANARAMPDIEIRQHRRGLPENRIHLAQDRCFYYHPKLFLTVDEVNLRIALAFQREVIHRIIPEVRPDLIHCCDWMTGLIPAVARRMGIPCLFTLYRPDSPQLLLSAIEERGIDAAPFWQYCYYSRMPLSYEETRGTNPVDLLTSAVFAAHSVVTLSGTFQKTLTDAQDAFTPPGLRTELAAKRRSGNLCTMEPAPDPSFDPALDRALMRTYGPADHQSAKLFNKLHLQEVLHLAMDSTAPVCFWPTRLDGARPGCRLMVDAVAAVLERYREQRLQIVFVADGDMQTPLRTLIDRLPAAGRVAVCDFDARRYRLAFGGSDFLLMPLYRDPVALPCKIGQRYGSLPIAYDAGAIHDCVTHLDMSSDRGSGFLFRYFDRQGLLWAMDQAMDFYRQPAGRRARQVQRIMAESAVKFNTATWVQQIIDWYARLGEWGPEHCPAAAGRTSDARAAA